MRRIVLLFTIVVTALSTGCGKNSFKKFSPPEGKFSVLMYGKPRKEEMSYGSVRMTMYGNASEGDEYAAGYSDLSGHNDFLIAAKLDEVVNSFNEGGTGNFTMRSGVTGGMGYRDFEFSSPKFGGSVCGRVIAARGVLYLVYAGGKEAHLSNALIKKYIESFRLTDGGSTPGRDEPAPQNSDPPPSGTASINKPKPPPRTESPPPSGPTVVSPAPDPGPTVVKPQPGNPPPVVEDDPPPRPDPPVRPGGRPRPNRPGGGFPDQPPMVGFGIGPEFQDSAPEGGLLIGFALGFGYATNSNDDILIAVQPIYRVPEKEKDQLGKIQGSDTRRVVREVAKPGYAVGAVHAKGGLNLDGFYITYMKVAGKQLDPSDAYNSIWLGGSQGNGLTTIGGDGRLVTGIIGRTNNKDLKAIGLEFGPLPTELVPVGPRPTAPRIPKAPRFVGGWGDPEFREDAPAGGLLVGFDIAPGGPFGNSIATVRPIYQVKGKDKDVFGLMHGSVTKGGIKERAKPGYAVGGINVKGGLWVDGFSITYMKILEDENKLDPNDKYESNWYGNGNGNDASIISGEGELAIGILGRQGRKDLNAIGLIFKPPEMTGTKPAEKGKADPDGKPGDAKKP